MTMLPRTVLATVLACSAAPAIAADEFIKGVYVESAKICAEAQKDLQAVIEGSNLLLSSSGFDALEYNCVFIDVKQHPSQEKAWLVTGICEAPDNMQPHMFAIVERQAGQLDVVSMEDGDDGEDDGLSGTYHYCEGVKLP
jgi:hypothetical protein